MAARRAIALAMVAFVLPSSAAAQGVIARGSLLERVPFAQEQGNDCAARWFPDTGGGPYQPLNSNVPTCSYYQGFVFGNSDDPRTGFVPSDGVINTVTVRSGPNPAPLRFMLARQLTPAQNGAVAGSTECCFFVRESGTVQPAPNTTTTFRLNFPAENNRGRDVITQDILGFSAASGDGQLPLAIIPEQFSFNAFTTPGTMTSGAYFPRLGALANDSGGGRREDNSYAGFELLMQYTFTPRRGTVSPGRGIAFGPTDITTIGGNVLRPAGGALDVTLACLQIRCTGSIALLTRPGGRAVAAAKPRTLSERRFALAFGTSRLPMRLNARGRRLSRGSAAKVAVVVSFGKFGVVRRNTTMRGRTRP